MWIRRGSSLHESVFQLRCTLGQLNSRWSKTEKLLTSLNNFNVKSTTTTTTNTLKSKYSYSLSSTEPHKMWNHIIESGYIFSVCVCTCMCEGGIDSSVHFQSTSVASNVNITSVDDVNSGTKAALSAGNTTVGQSQCHSGRRTPVWSHCRTLVTPGFSREFFLLCLRILKLL